MLDNIYSLQIQNIQYPIETRPYLSNIDSKNKCNLTKSSTSGFQGLNINKKFGPREYQFHPQYSTSNYNESNKKTSKPKTAKNKRVNSSL